MSPERFLSAAQRVLDGDESADAASELAGVVRADYPDDDRVDDLLDVLSRYSAAPSSTSPVAEEVRTVLRETMARIM